MFCGFFGGAWLNWFCSKIELTRILRHQICQVSVVYGGPRLKLPNEGTFKVNHAIFNIRKHYYTLSKSKYDAW